MNIDKNIKIFDSHAHYDDESFNEDREDIINSIKENGVIGVINCGASLNGARDSVKLSKEYDFFYSAVGIHPENANELNDESYEEIKELSKFHKVKAIGEIGLDYYWDENPDREVQKDVFRKQMKLAKELDLPVIIHDRDAHLDTLQIIKEFEGVTGVVHCFSGSKEFAKQCIDRGYYIGFTGVVTFKNAKKIIEVIKEVPLDKILVETDCPYMAPVPNRGKRNRSDYIEFIIEKISEVKGIEITELSEILINNTKKLFKI